MNSKFVPTEHKRYPFIRFLFTLSLLLFFIFLICPAVSAQNITIKGSVIDTARHKPLQNAMVMAIKLKDSVLVKFTRTDVQGLFKMESMPVDTYQVIISHPFFGDQATLVFGSKAENEFNLPNVILPPKGVTLNEVTILGYADPVYYKGDTLIYTADSFKVKKNAVVEDLLKKLPGIRVDDNGKIFSQGKAVDQVLVDGDEFFGTDPTIATKNLPANSVASVQVYDKKNEDATESTDKETLKVMDLKLKDDAKKGYFGKVSGATDFNNFYEGELLVNKFKGKQKISLFMLGSNTPRTSFNWSDMYQYGMNGDMNMGTNDDGSSYYSYENSRSQGIPKTFKTGFYYSDQLNKKTKVGLNYTYSKASLLTETSTASQFFLPDTSYKTSDVNNENRNDESHTLNATINYTVDSLTELMIQSKFKNDDNSQNILDNQTYLTSSDIATRITNTENANDGSVTNWDNSIKLTRNFKKKDRKFIATYDIKMTNTKTDGILKWNNHNLISALPDSSIDEKKISASDNQIQTGSLTYIEPLSKKMKLEFSYDFNITAGNQDKSTRDFFNGNYDVENPEYSNSFKTTRNINRLGAKFSYDAKKQSFTAGTRLRQVDATNTNLETGDHIFQQVNNVLPYASYRYKFNDNEVLSFRYTTSSQQPSMNQLQPIPDNTNPNYIVKGNPDLLPTFSNSFNLDFYSYKPLSGKNFYANFNFTSTNNDFSNSVIYDNLGRTITLPINVQGDYYSYMYAASDYPVDSRVFIIEPNINFNLSKNTNYINGEKNVTKNFSPTFALDVRIHPDSIIEFRIGGNYSYNGSSSSLNMASDKSYYANNYKLGTNVDLPWKMRVETEANYYLNERREEGYNLHYLIWNASLQKRLLKNENLTISVDATDLLNQNISTQRNVSDNVISDIKTNVIGRYILLKAVYRFNSNKKKQEDEYDEY